MAGFRELLPQIEARGARLFVIGMGSTMFIPEFRQQTGYQGPILIDPERKAYQAAALRRPRLGMFHPGSILAGLSALQAGYRQSAPQGDAAQLGGVFVIAPGNRILLEHTETYAGDTLDPARLLAVLQQAGRTGSGVQPRQRK